MITSHLNTVGKWRNIQEEIRQAGYQDANKEAINAKSSQKDACKKPA